MASSTIIELKELQSGSKDQPELNNGNFKQILKNPITIENGDELSIHAGFIDTIQSSQGKIDIDGTEEFKIGYTPFFQSYDKLAKTFNGLTPKTNLTSGLKFDNDAYYPCAGGHASIPDLVLVNSIKFIRKESEPDNWGGVSAYFSYTNDQGKAAGTIVTLPFIKAVPSPGGYAEFIVDVNIVCKAHTFIFAETAKQQKEFLRKGKIGSYEVKETARAPSSLNLEPLTFEYTFSLPKGSYEPKHICELVTENLTNLQNVATASHGNQTVTNAFLKTNGQINNITNTYTGEGKTVYVNQKGNLIVQLPDNQHYPSSSSDPDDIVPGFDGHVYESFIGSDQVVLEFDIDTQKCVWAQLHSNIYSAGTTAGGGNYNEDGSIVVKSYPFEYTPPTDGTQEYVYASRNGCVGFNYLSPSDFWFDKLGLDPAICFSFEPHLTNATIGTFTGLDTYRVKGGLIDGINTTNSIVSNSLAITKNQFFSQVPSRAGLEGTSTSNIKCYGLNSLNAPTLEEGYFLISIDGFDNNQKLINKYDEKNTIKSIVSRFYTTNSYTSFYGEGNVSAYQHYGEPITISSFTVKILNPQYEYANIQDDNTIFLELIKPLPQLKQ